MFWIIVTVTVNLFLLAVVVNWPISSLEIKCHLLDGRIKFRLYEFDSTQTLDRVVFTFNATGHYDIYFDAPDEEKYLLPADFSLDVTSVPHTKVVRKMFLPKHLRTIAQLGSEVDHISYLDFPETV